MFLVLYAPNKSLNLLIIIMVKMMTDSFEPLQGNRYLANALNMLYNLENISQK